MMKQEKELKQNDYENLNRNMILQIANFLRILPKFQHSWRMIGQEHPE